MQSRIGPTLLVAALATATSAAKADDGFYVSGSAGAAFREAFSTQQVVDVPVFVGTGPNIPGRGVSGAINPSGPPGIVLPTPVTAQDKYHYSPGFTLNAALGYKFDLDEWGAIRTEAELGYTSYDLDRVAVSDLDQPALSNAIDRVARVTHGATALRVSGTINAFYDLPVSGPLIPYLGVGLGGQHGENSSGTAVGTYASGLTVPNRVLGASGQSGIWLAEAGFSVPLTDAISLVPAYRYEQTFNSAQTTQIAKIGVRYSF